MTAARAYIQDSCAGCYSGVAISAGLKEPQHGG